MQGKSKKLLLAVLVAAGFVYASNLLIGLTNDTKQPNYNSEVENWVDEVDKIGAYIASERFVKSRLIAPATAEFPSFRNEQVEYLGNQEYKIHSWVDAENVYGANVRHRYTATLRQEEKGNWKLISLDIE